MRCGLDGNRLGSLHGFFEGYLQFLIGCNQRMCGLVYFTMVDLQRFGFLHARMVCSFC